MLKRRLQKPLEVSLDVSDGVCLESIITDCFGPRVQIRSATLNNWLGGRDALAFAPLDRQVKVTRI